eukprot:3694199-Rhodomonas_salina.1
MDKSQPELFVVAQTAGLVNVTSIATLRHGRAPPTSLYFCSLNITALSVTGPLFSCEVERAAEESESESVCTLSEEQLKTDNSAKRIHRAWWEPGTIGATAA